MITLLLLFTIVGDVRRVTATGDLASAEKLIREYRQASGTTTESIEAYSWLARTALAAKKYDEAVRYAAETEKQVLARLPAKRDRPISPWSTPSRRPLHRRGTCASSVAAWCRYAMRRPMLRWTSRGCP